MSLTELTDFHLEVNRLKKTKRYSSCPDHIRDSTADHSWKLALMTVDVAHNLQLDVDVLYSTKLALCHDICEYRDTNDFDSFDVARGISSKEDKERAEEKTVKYLADNFGRQDIYDMWLDFESAGTPEARYVRALDKIESQLHVIESGAIDKQEGAGHTVTQADERVLAFPELTPLLREVKGRLKTVLLEKGLEWKPEYDRV